MSVENVAKFYNEVMKDEQLKGKLKDVNEKTLTEEVFKSKVLPEAKAKGYDFTYADMKEYYKKQGGMTELDMDEMESVSGGCGSDDADKYKMAQVGPNDTCTERSYCSLPWDETHKPKCGDGCNQYKPYGNYHYCNAKIK